MRKHVAILILFEKQTMIRIFLIFTAMVAAQTGLFVFSFHPDFAGTEYKVSSFSDIFQRNYMILSFVLALLFLTILLTLNGMETKGKQSYTMRRLSVHRKVIYLWQGFYNTGCYFLFFVIQILSVLLMYIIYQNMTGDGTTANQTLFLSFYTNRFLHSLLPFEDVTRWIRNGCLILSLGFCTAYYPYVQERKPRYVLLAILCPYIIIFFSGPLGSIPADIVSICIFLYILVYCIWQVFRKEVTDER